ncbi:MAG TPA: hypothetical protein VJU15_12180 [Gemmatimonadales bacterium]|nr:hypothetical protein [Gemmatimonadales bacterium]
MSKRFLGLALLAGILSCGGSTEPDGPQAGVVVASLNTPNDQDGALIIRIVGQQTGLTALGGYHLATANALQGTTMRGIVTGSIVDGDLLEFTIPDISKVSTYVVVVEQAADRGTYALIDPSGYNISLRVK